MRKDDALLVTSNGTWRKQRCRYRRSPVDLCRDCSAPRRHRYLRRMQVVERQWGTVPRDGSFSGCICHLTRPDCNDSRGKKKAKYTMVRGSITNSVENIIVVLIQVGYTLGKEGIKASIFYMVHDAFIYVAQHGRLHTFLVHGMYEIAKSVLCTKHFVNEIVGNKVLIEAVAQIMNLHYEKVHYESHLERMLKRLAETKWLLHEKDGDDSPMLPTHAPSELKSVGKRKSPCNINVVFIQKASRKSNGCDCKKFGIIARNATKTERLRSPVTAQRMQDVREAATQENLRKAVVI